MATVVRPKINRQECLARFREVRATSLAMCARLEPAEYRLQPIADVSPPWWNLGHTSWFFARNVLQPLGGTWTATLETGAPTAAQQQALEKVAAEFGGEGYTLYGDTPRKPGDRWEVDASKLGEFGGLESLAGTFRVEFIEVKEFKGTPCAVLEMKIEISGLATRERSIKPMSMKLKGNAVVHRSLEDLVDLEQLLEGEATIEGEPAPGMSMWTKGPMKVTSQASVQPR